MNIEETNDNDRTIVMNKSTSDEMTRIINQLEADKLELSKAIIDNCLVFKYSDWIECVHCEKGTQITDKESYDNHDKDCIVNKAQKYIKGEIR